MGIAGLFGDAINSVVSLFNGGTASLYITEGIDHAIQHIQGENWKLNLGYSFDVEGAGDSGQSFKPFPLQVNPSSLEQRENPNTVITPTQTGVCVEYQGFITKDLVISGTTAIQPGRGAGGVTGGINFGLSSQIIPSGVPLFGGKWGGYMEMMLLRNYFRAYAEVKKNHAYRNLKLVFHNRKDNEHWYVEPNGAGVTVSRSSARPMMYDYSIDLKIVGKATAGTSGFTGPLGDILNGIQNVENFIQDVSDSIDFFTGVVEGATSFFENFEKNVAITILDPFKKISKAVGAIRDGSTRVSALPKTFYKDAQTSMNRVRDNFADWVGKGSTGYDTTKGRIALAQSRDFILDDVEIFKAFIQAQRALNRILASDVLFISDSGDTTASATSSSIDTAIAINQSIIADSRIGSLASLSNQFGGDYNFSVPAAVSQYAIEYGETIERFAARVLGNATRVNEIILLNNLDPPYVSETPEDGVNTVASGDLLLVPALGQGQSGASTIKKRGTSRILRDLTTLEKELGVDLRLTSEGDLAVDTSIPDLKLIAGFDNAAQALGIAIGLERGDLLYHPKKGIGPQIGKSNTLTAGEIALEIETSILSDKRFLGINSLTVVRNQLNITLSAVVSIRNVNRPVPLKLDVSNVGS